VSVDVLMQYSVIIC